MYLLVASYWQGGYEEAAENFGLCTERLSKGSIGYKRISAIARLEDRINAAQDRIGTTTLELLDMALQSDSLAAQSILNRLRDLYEQGASQ